MKKAKKASDDSATTTTTTTESQRRRRSSGGVLAQKISLERRAVYDLLITLADKLIDDDRSGANRSTDRFRAAAMRISSSVTTFEPIVERVSVICYRYDFDQDVPGNGYRSVIATIDTCVLHLLRLVREILEQKDSIFFRTNYYLKELEAFTTALCTLVAAAQRMYRYLPCWPESDLFASDDVVKSLNDLMSEIESLDQSCFYGRAMGFQFCSSLYRTFQVIGISLASYSLLWDSGRPASTWTGAASTILTSGQYVINPEERAKRIFDVTLNADIAFCKAFWNLTEGPLLQRLPKFFTPYLTVNEIWQIPGDLSLFLLTNDDVVVSVPPPSAHTGTRSLPVRVLSCSLREGMPTGSASRAKKNGSHRVLPPSRTLLFHVHGGGFVATTTKTHEPYLRHWAKSLNCPIVSIDYSLAPENPYPRATEEVYYAYAWVLSNAERLGWTGERICFVGDSAGGMLLASTTLRLVKKDIRRLPDGLVLVYPAFLAQYSPSPARMLSLLDPLLPLGVVTRCLAAYTGNADYLKSTTESEKAAESHGFHRNDPDRANSVAMELEQGNDEIDDEPIDEAENDSIGHVRSSSSSSEETKIVDTGHAKLTRTSGRDRRGLRHSKSDDGPIKNTSDCSSKSDDSGHQESEESSISSSEEVTDQLTEIERSTVAIQKDPKLIVVSTSIYDNDFVSYLSQHPLTKPSFQRLTIPALVSSRLPKENRRSSADDSPAVTPPAEATSNDSTATSTLGDLTRASANMGQKVGLYLMDNLSGWFDPSDSCPTPAMVSSPLSKFHDMPVPKDPFLSPLLAPNDWLAKFPRTAIVACHLDPLLDDSVTFAKRLKKMGAPVTLDLMDSLPHGFLNFTLFSPECREAARVCVQRMREIFDGK